MIMNEKLPGRWAPKKLCWARACSYRTSIKQLKQKRQRNSQPEMTDGYMTPCSYSHIYNCTSYAALLSSIP